MSAPQNFSQSEAPPTRAFSRKPKFTITTNDLPYEPCSEGYYTPAGIFFVAIKLTVPLAYIYIVLILLSELCEKFPQTVHGALESYIPPLSALMTKLQTSSTPILDSWAILEAIFYTCLIIHLQWLQYKCPLEASLSCAPLMELPERQVIWDRIMESEKDDPVSFVTGWFFDASLDKISRYDVRDFLAWSMFDARNQEHLSNDECRQLDTFLLEFEWRIALYLHGAATEGEADKAQMQVSFSAPPASLKREKSTSSYSLPSCSSMSNLRKVFEKNLPEPKQAFRFHLCIETPPSFFSNLYENYKQTYEQYREMLNERTPNDFNPVQGFRNFVATKKQQINQVEESAIATASQVYENASNIYENAYYNVIDRGGNVDKQLTALGHATYNQLTEAWNSMVEMNKRFEMAKFISKRKKKLRQQLKGYQVLLDRTRTTSVSSAIPSRQMAELMRKITQINDAMERIESSARDAFVNATGYAEKNLISMRAPQRYAKYSYDPLLGVSQYPLCFHMLILALTEGGLRMLMMRRGFQRRTVGQIAYYYHPGLDSKEMEDTMNNHQINENDSNIDEEPTEKPIIFVHGIGIGLLYYMPLIDSLLALGRPIFLPEIPYVTGFRTWQNPSDVLSPGAASSTITAMIASHGFLRGSFIGHSYGTSWLSFMCKYSPNAVESIIFLDPICFCLHMPFLTKQFVYHQADPGSVSNFVRTDVIINWTIQRRFPWSRICLFMEDIPANCKFAVFLAEADALVPVSNVLKYLKNNNCSMKNWKGVGKDHFKKSHSPYGVTRTCVLFDKIQHGDWIANPAMLKMISSAVASFENKSENR